MGEKADPVLRAFAQQRRDAKKRGIEFLLSFSEWKEIWDRSGKFHIRGRYKGQYVMARDGDVGPYALGNVSISLCEDNHRDAALRGKGRPKSDACKEKLRQAHLGKKLTDETKRKIGLAQKGISKGPMIEGTKQKLRQAHLGKKGHRPTEEGIRRIREAKRAYWAKRRAEDD